MKTLAIAILSAALSLPFAAFAAQATNQPEPAKKADTAKKPKKHAKKHHKKATTAKKSGATSSSTPAPAPAK